MSDLLIGCGRTHKRRIDWGKRKEWNDLVTLDMNPDHKPNVVWDLNKRPLPFEDNSFDEIHAYDVLEHLGQQGDYRTFFDEFSEWYRLLKPDGVLCGISPQHSNGWTFGDPGHTRVLSRESFVYLDQEEYRTQIGITALTDYRFLYKADFRLIDMANGGPCFLYVLQAIKPSRIGTQPDLSLTQQEH